jgi:hypothetical protein
MQSTMNLLLDYLFKDFCIIDLSHCAKAFELARGEYPLVEWFVKLWVTCHRQLVIGSSSCDRYKLNPEVLKSSFMHS